MPKRNYGKGRGSSVRAKTIASSGGNRTPSGLGRNWIVPGKKDVHLPYGDQTSGGTTSATGAAVAMGNGVHNDGAKGTITTSVAVPVGAKILILYTGDEATFISSITDSVGTISYAALLQKHTGTADFVLEAWYGDAPAGLASGSVITYNTTGDHGTAQAYYLTGVATGAGTAAQDFTFTETATDNQSAAAPATAIAAKDLIVIATAWYNSDIATHVSGMAGTTVYASTQSDFFLNIQGLLVQSKTAVGTETVATSSDNFGSNPTTKIFQLVFRHATTNTTVTHPEKVLGGGGGWVRGGLPN